MHNYFISDYFTAARSVNSFIRKGFLASIVLALGACSHGAPLIDASSGAAPVQPKSAAELRAELLAQEQQAPDEYLRVAGNHRRNLLGQLVLEGEITNQATLASFRDPVVHVEWYSAAHTLLATMAYPVHELLPPQGSAHFKLKTVAPGEVASVALGIAEAAAAD